MMCNMNCKKWLIVSFVCIILLSATLIWKVAFDKPDVAKISHRIIGEEGFDKIEYDSIVIKYDTIYIHKDGNIIKNYSLFDTIK